ncbi:MAG TPA: phosphatase [Candidatus Scatomorpha stercoravium]|nr:phosphatase [Candidatus Scatomorpha stercoravium]
MTRHKNDSNLSDEARAARARYLREWRARNRERVREYNARYWARKASEAKADEKEADNHAEANL